MSRNSQKSRPGRNDRCPCGNGKKYKNCCATRQSDDNDRLRSILLGITTPQSSPDYSLQERNRLLLNGMADVFRIRRDTQWDDIRRNITPDTVRKFYELIAYIWPPWTNHEELLAFADTRLRAIYMGDIASSTESVTKSICQFSLYTDEILIVDPLKSPWRLAPPFNPLLHPERYLSDTVRVVFFLLQIAPWVQSGLITLVPNPADFDRDLWNQMLRDGQGWEERLKGLMDKGDIEQAEDELRPEIERHMLSAPPESLRAMIRDHEPRAGEEEVERRLRALLARRDSDPMRLDLPFDLLRTQMVISRSGAGILGSLRLCDLTGAFPYTNRRSTWKVLLESREDLSEVSQVWSPLTTAFQSLDFKFLNNVDLEFARQIREEERLASFRNYLRKVWVGVKGEPDLGKMDGLARDFRDELTDAYRSAQADWDEIDRDLLKTASATTFGVGMATAVGSALVTGGLSLALPAVAAAFGTVPALVKSHLDRKKFRSKVPLSVLVDLRGHRVAGTG
ncbi:MAG: SEC-C metal-binding domain-containing protein [Spirochaetaceae bacterium]|nr:SEC-C metal-binding domain-containing protein [Spirochaetaceae bacterium]